MGSITEAVGRFVLTYVPLSVMAAFLSTFYPSLIVYSVYLMIAFWLGAVLLAVHAAVRGTPRVLDAYKLIVAIAPAWYPLARFQLYGPTPEFGSLLAAYAFWTAVIAFQIAFAYFVVYRLRLLDRDGPVGRRLGLA